MNELLALRPHRLVADTERVLASLGEVLDAPYMIYSRSKSSDLQFAPFTDAAGTVYANSVNGFESNFETHSDASVRRNAWAQSGHPRMRSRLKRQRGQGRSSMVCRRTRPRSE